MLLLTRGSAYLTGLSCCILLLVPPGCTFLPRSLEPLGYEMMYVTVETVARAVVVAMSSLYQSVLFRY